MGQYYNLVGAGIPVSAEGTFEFQAPLPDPVFPSSQPTRSGPTNVIESRCSNSDPMNDPEKATVAVDLTGGVAEFSEKSPPPAGLTPGNPLLVPAGGKSGTAVTLWTDLTCPGPNVADDATIWWGTHRLARVTPGWGPAMRHAFYVPAGPESGPQQIKILCDSAEFPTVQTVSFTVDGPPKKASPSPAPTPVSASQGDAALAGPRSQAAAELPSATDLFAEPEAVAVVGATVVIGLPVLGFAAELFNKTVEENRLRIRRFFRPGGAAPRSRPRHPSLHIAAFVLLSLLFTLVVEPGAGLGQRTFALTCALLVAIPLTVLAYAVSAEFFRRKLSPVRAYPTLIPGALGLAVVLGAASRLVDLTPGYVYGLILAFPAVFPRGLSPQDEGRAVGFGAQNLTTLAILSWCALVPVRSLVEDTDNPGFGLVFTENLLSQLFVTGVVGLVFGLLPLTFLDGHLLWRWSRPVWCVLYGLVLFLFLGTLVDPGGPAQGVTRDVWLRSVVAFGVFTVFSLGFWAYFRLRPAPAAG